ncbi:MAG: bifunctional riboflavin kinase/FAD synthetase [Gammaproteobacteria bacterium]|nr:bifunctional riboflavin kinase/FAD synthetase [Gammaproteobacteria bacterium]
MELIRGRQNIHAVHRGCVATIGNFDGVHRGHQRIIAQLAEAASRHQVPSTVIVFEPQTAEFFRPAEPPARISLLRDKYRLLAAAGVERVVVLNFNASLASLPAEEFVAEILVQRLGVRELVIGDDFRFGRGRSGDFALLEAMAGASGYVVQRAEPVNIDGERVSSTRIRTLLDAGEFAAAARMLGRKYRIGGRIVAGKANGRTIGFPTINIPLRRRRSPLHGIFAARVHGLATAPVNGAAYIGTRAVINESTVVLEVNLFDFSRDCYGERVEVEFVEKIRDELPFADFESLRRQIAEDVAAARQSLTAADGYEINA